MKQTIGTVSLLVRDYDEAIEYFSRKLDFRVVEDTAIESEDKRWVVIAPPGSGECGLLLAKPRREEDAAMIGRQAGRRVFLFLHTDDFWRDHRKFLERGVHFCEAPRKEAYGTVVVFEDPRSAILDRFLQHAHLIAITGKSYRLKDTPLAKTNTKE